MVHLRESSDFYQRRLYETARLVQFQAMLSKSHPNYWMMQDLRKLYALEHLYKTAILI